jgi:HTH-type transcriptional regulator, sugar sensing transcriptional regulator
MNLSHELAKIGLSDKEAAAYLTLLRSGTRSTSFVAKKAGLNRGTAYVVLHSLLSKGLVVKSTKKKVQYFTAQDPKHILQYLDWKEKEIQTQKEKVQGLMGQLAALVNPLTTQPKIQFFDGVDGARTVLEDTISSNDKLLRAFLSIGDIQDFLGPEYFYDYTMRRINSGYTLHAIRTLEKDREARAKYVYSKRYVTSRKDRRIVRHVSEDLAFPVTTYMYDDKLTVISSKAEGYAFIIQSFELSQMQKKLFSLVWNSLD